VEKRMKKEAEKEMKISLSFSLCSPFSIHSPFRFILSRKVFAVSSAWLLDVLDVSDAAGNGDGSHR
jgi:hypothetical protein